MANKNLKIKKYTRIIECIAKEKNISLDSALEMFYKSNSYNDLDLEISNFFCEGDLYIAQCIIDESK